MREPPKEYYPGQFAEWDPFYQLPIQLVGRRDWTPERNRAAQLKFEERRSTAATKVKAIIMALIY